MEEEFLEMSFWLWKRQGDVLNATFHQHLSSLKKVGFPKPCHPLMSICPMMWHRGHGGDLVNYLSLGGPLLSFSRSSAEYLFFAS